MTLPSNARTIADAVAKKFEGCVLTPYRDIAGYPTVGWGNRNLLDGSPVTMATPPITQAVADQLFDHAMAMIEPKLDAMLKIPVAAYEAGALLSMQYNIGSSALAGSTVIRLLNAGDRVGAAGHMLDWDMAAGKVSAGLLRRRQMERAVFLGLVNPLNPIAAAVPVPTVKPVTAPQPTADDLNAQSLAGTLNFPTEI